MERTVMWSRLDSAGMEHLALHRDGSRVVADGTVLLLRGEEPLRIGYSLSLTSAWQVRMVSVDIPGGTPRVLRLKTDGEGNWETGLNEPLPDLEGCLDVDLAFTPFTNSLPIRRLSLAEGDSAELKMVYVTVPDLHVHADGQRYTCQVDEGDREAGDWRGVYRYQAGARGRDVELAVDSDGLVRDYPGIFKRVWPA